MPSIFWLIVIGPHRDIWELIASAIGGSFLINKISHRSYDSMIVSSKAHDSLPDPSVVLSVLRRHSYIVSDELLRMALYRGYCSGDYGIEYL